MDSRQKSTGQMRRISVRYRVPSGIEAEIKKRAIAGVMLEAMRREGTGPSVVGEGA